MLAIGAPLLQQNITDSAETLLYNLYGLQKDAPLKYSLEQNVGQGAVKRCIEIAQKFFSIAKMHIGNFCKFIAPALTHQPAVVTF